MTEGKTLFVIKKNGETVDAEWLFINHNAFENTLSSLMERLNQLSKPISEDQVIAGIQLSRDLSCELPGSHIKSDSKTEKAVMRYDSVLLSEKRAITEEIGALEERAHELQSLLLLHKAVMEGLTDQEKWLAEQYYQEGLSLDVMVHKLEECDIYISKSTLRRRKIQLIEKAQQLLYALHYERTERGENLP